MSELVTGEAVVLGLQPAKLPSRIVAVAIDLVVWWGTYLLVSLVLFSATGSLDTAAQAAVAVASLLLCLVGLPVMVETLSRGRSLGKLVFGLRVVRDDGGPVRFRHALVRGAVGLVEIQLSLGVIASIASLVSARGRRIGDVFAGTLVLRERIPAQQLQQPPPPPWLAAQMSGMDLSGLPEGLWLAVRQYLSRMWQLDPQVSWDMAGRLAGDVAALTGRAVPPGVPPAAYLAAVVAERQARDARRVFGDGRSQVAVAQGEGVQAGVWGGEPPVAGWPGQGGVAVGAGARGGPVSGWQSPGGGEHTAETGAVGHVGPVGPVGPGGGGGSAPEGAGDGGARPATGFAPPA